MRELTSSLEKLIKKLQKSKRWRHSEKRFIAEGHKVVLELINSPYREQIEVIIGTPTWITENIPEGMFDVIMVPRWRVDALSALESGAPVLAVVSMKEQSLDITSLKESIVVCLDGVQDPGNAGTIIRTCHFFGVYNVICGRGTVDAWNPKAVQASMGSIFYVNVFYTDLPEFIVKYSKETGNHSFAFTLDGDNIALMPHISHCALIFGNESRGVSRETLRHVYKKVKIPAFDSGADSLSVGASVAIALYEMRKPLLL